MCPSHAVSVRFLPQARPDLLEVFSITRFRNTKSACPEESGTFAEGDCSPCGVTHLSLSCEEETWLMSLAGRLLILLCWADGEKLWITL